MFPIILLFYGVIVCFWNILVTRDCAVVLLLVNANKKRLTDQVTLMLNGVCRLLKGDQRLRVPTFYF